MNVYHFRERLLKRLIGPGLLDNAGAGEVRAALAGAGAPLAPLAQEADAIAPWSLRHRDEPATRLLRVLAALIVLFLAWAALFSLDRVTRGQGHVLPSVQNQVVQHLEGGIVEAILVREGQRVRKGQVLLRLGNAATGAEFETAHTELVAKKIALARMDAELAGAGGFATPAALAKQAPDIAAREEALFSSRRAQRAQASSIIAEQGRGHSAEVASLRSRLGNLHTEEALMQQQLDKLERAYAEDAISEREVLDKRQALASLRTRIADVANQIPQTSAAVSEAAARRAEITTRDMQETREKATILRLELAKAGETFNAVEDKAARQEIRAPMDGIVNRLYVQTVGGVIRPGEPVAEIVPVDKSVLIEARVAPRDRGHIWPGLPASVKITAYDSAIFGGLDARVVDISPDVLQDPKGESYYRVRLRADTGDFGRDKPVIPGMTAEVNIRSGKQTILAYILGPLVRIRDEALRE
ncbi:MAG: HlyD family type I secretion periplasmic adaptor subunit [Sphingomonadales bacterium]|nr:HlyD family type I secretion periplasmic adaptor subunit [Sphingomonadales bacterium]